MLYTTFDNNGCVPPFTQSGYLPLVRIRMLEAEYQFIILKILIKDAFYRIPNKQLCDIINKYVISASVQNVDTPVKIFNFLEISNAPKWYLFSVPYNAKKLRDHGNCLFFFKKGVQNFK